MTEVFRLASAQEQAHATLGSESGADGVNGIEEPWHRVAIGVGYALSEFLCIGQLGRRIGSEPLNNGGGGLLATVNSGDGIAHDFRSDLHVHINGARFATVGTGSNSSAHGNCEREQSIGFHKHKINNFAKPVQLF